MTTKKPAVKKVSKKVTKSKFADKDFSHFAPKTQREEDTINALRSKNNKDITWLNIFITTLSVLLLVTFLASWLYIAEQHTKKNNAYWTKQVEACKAIGGTLTIDGCN